MQLQIQQEQQRERERAERHTERRERLKVVFKEFDLDGNGSIETKELLLLGKARRELNQKEGNWTAEQNQRLVSKLDTDRDGTVSESEFVKHFDEELPFDRDAFNEEISRFLIAAKAVRRRSQSPPRNNPPRTPPSVAKATTQRTPSKPVKAPEVVMDPDIDAEVAQLRAECARQRRALILFAILAVSIWTIWLQRPICDIRGPLH